MHHIKAVQERHFIFNYIVESGHNFSDLDYISSSALNLNNGSIKDSYGNALMLPFLHQVKVDHYLSIKI